MSELLDLVAECLQRMEAEGPAALDELCRAHPALAGELRERVAQLRGAGMLADTPPERLGDFRLLQRLGSGGMGVVYLAEQISLRRRVALKLIRPEHLYFPGARERFRREVDAVARLQHPGIVPVLTFGEEAGVPYFAMEYVRGATLQKVVEALQGSDPGRLNGGDLRRVVEEASGESASGEGGERLFAGPWVAVALRLVRQVAGALQHAHERGVLHRDIKPGNVMVTPDGRALLLDFGLALSQGSERMTQTGTPLGSLAFMSPEQVRGEHEALDGRTDVYSLGVTLYELLTLRAPYACDSMEGTRARVLAGEPRLPRELNPAVSRDAETVCLMAMDRERERRYAGAAEFAADIGNVLELRPVRARRAGPLLRARRWAQRRPAAAVGLVLGSLLLVGGPLAFGIQQHAANLRVAEERDRAQANLERAQRAVDVLLTQVADEELLAVPQMEQVRARLLGSALTFYEEFLADDEGDPGLRWGTALSAQTAASILQLLGRYDESLAAYDRVERLARASPPDDADWLDLLSDALCQRAALLGELGRTEQALADVEQSLELRRRRWERDPADVPAMLDVEEVVGNRATLLASLGRLQEAEAGWTEQVRLNEQLLATTRGTERESRLLRSYVIALSNFGNFLKNQGRHAEALPLLESAADQAAGIDMSQIGDPFAAAGVGASSVNLAGVLWELGERQRALSVMNDAILRIEAAYADSPGYIQLRRLLCTAHSNLGRYLADDPARREEALAAYTRSEALQRVALDEEADVPVAQATLGCTLVNHAAVLRDLGQHAEALALLEQASRLVRSALAQQPDEPGWGAYLHSALWFTSLSRRDLQQPEEAAAAAEELAAAFSDARTLRIAAGLVAGCQPLDEARRAQALDLLRRALDAGLGAEQARSSADLQPLQGDPVFERLVGG